MSSYAGTTTPRSGTWSSCSRASAWTAEHIVDLGDITAARGTEAYVALWIRLWGVVGGPDFNIRLVR